MEGNLKHGDQARIAELTGYTHDYVKKVIQGRRHNKKILDVAKQLVESRRNLATEINTRK